MRSDRFSTSRACPSTAGSIFWSRRPLHCCTSTDRKSTRLNSSHSQISYAVFCLKKKKIWPDKQYLTNKALSDALPYRPVVLNSVVGHTLLANAKAIQMASVAASTAYPSDGRNHR